MNSNARKEKWLLSRRQMVAGLGAMPLALYAGRSLAEGAAPAAAQGQSASRVYLDYTQAELDDAYDQRVWASNAKEMIGRYKSDSETARKNLPFETHSYGPSAAETVDVFKPAGDGAPIHVHLHGGAWRALTKDDMSFLAPALVDSGAVYVALNFATMPDVRLPEMMEQCRRAIAWIHQNAEMLGGDANRIHISGHSSGAHMAGVLMTTDWQAEGLPRDVLKSGLLISGMYDLEPVMLSARSSYVELSEAEVDALSAMRHIDRLVSPVVITYGSEESPEFKRQSRDFAAAVAKAGKTQMLLPVEGRNHFEMPYAALEPGSIANLATRMLMRAGTKEDATYKG